MPTVSVVIPVFNGERFIADAIRSVLAQTFRDFEIIVVDDGSTDRTASVVRQFPAPVSYYRRPKSGAAVARNFGVSAARGEWIAFLDADDLWYPRKLEVQMAHAAKLPEVDFFYADLNAVDADGNCLTEGLLQSELKRMEKKPRPNLINIVFGRRPFPRPSAVLLKRERFLNAGGFNPKFRTSNHEDFELFARLAQSCTFHFIAESLAKYRVHPMQGTGDTAGFDENWLMLLNCLWESYRDEPQRQAQLLHYYAKYFSNQGKELIVAGNYREARRRFALAFRYEPLDRKNLGRWLLSHLPAVRQLDVARRRAVSLRDYKNGLRRYFEYARRAFLLSRQ